MRRIAAAGVIAIVALGAAAMPAPPAPPQPDFAGPVASGGPTGPLASVWYCPWMHAGADRDSTLMAASLPATDALLSLPSLLPNEPPLEEAFTLPEPGSREIDIADIVRNGDAPGFIEFAEGPAGASATMFGETIIAGDRCTADVPKLWHVTGGTTRNGRTMLLRLFNPFPEEAKVTVTGFSELGPEALPELEIIDVAGRSWETIEFNPIVPFLDDLALLVSSEEGGVVVPALVMASETDEATWPGTGLSTLWEFPTVRQGGTVPSLVVTNPGLTGVTMELDVIGPNGMSPAVDVRLLDPGSPVRIELDDLAGGPFGIRLRSDGPVSAVVVTEDPPPGPTEGVAVSDVEDIGPQRIAGTIGSQPATSWILAGAGAVLEGQNVIWLMNTTEEQVTVTLTPVGLDPMPSDKVVLGPGTMRRHPLEEDVSIASYVLDASGPITASWSAATEEAIALYAGIPVER